MTRLVKPIALALLAVVALGGCAESTNNVNAPEVPVQKSICARWTDADVRAAKLALGEVDYGGGDIEPLALLAAGVNGKGEWDGVVLRKTTGAMIAVDNDYGLTENQARLLLQPGDIITADLIYGDTYIEDVHVIRKQAFTVTPPPCDHG